MSLVALACDWYARNRETLTAVDALLGGGLLTWGALRQQPLRLPRRNRSRRSDPAPTSTAMFSQAIEQIGSAKLAVCLGGIHTLDRIARQSRPDHGAVTEILAALIRQRAPWPDPAAAAASASIHDAAAAPSSYRWQRSADVAAALDVIIRRRADDRIAADARLNLTRTNLARAALRQAPLHGADLFAANLTEADLAAADLSQADLRRACLHRATLVGANLVGANLTGSDLTQANGRAADLTGATISWADLSGADPLCGEPQRRHHPRSPSQRRQPAPSRPARRATCRL